MISIPINDDKLKEYDAVIIATDHSNVDYNMICSNISLVIDTRNATKHISSKFSDKIVKA